MSIYLGNSGLSFPGLSKILLGDKEIWSDTPTPAFTGLCLTANTAGSTVTLGKTGSPAWTGSYSTNGSTWNEYVPGTTGAITLTNAGDKVYFKGDITANFQSNYLQFNLTGSIAASGNCNSMYISENFDTLTTLTYGNCYTNLFQGCTSLTTPPQLPATTLSYSCYSGMFSGCTSLLVTPELPAITLSSQCYNGMFVGCRSLTATPLLPATNTPAMCYMSMFSNCRSLTTISKLPSTTLNGLSYKGIFTNNVALYISDTPTEAAQYALILPSSNTFTTTSSQMSPFYGCAGTRSTDNMPGEAGQKYIYYTQNPVLGVTYKSITYNLTNITSVNNPNYIPVTDSFPLMFTAAEGYSLPSSVTVTGATGTWDQATGKLTLSDITGDISVSISGQSSISCLGTWVGKTNESFTEDAVTILGGWDPTAVSPDAQVLKCTYRYDITGYTQQVGYSDTYPIYKLAMGYKDPGWASKYYALLANTDGGDMSWAKALTDRKFVISGGNDINNANMYTFLTTYFTKQES